MKFQHLPAEMIEKVLDATDRKTFEELRFVNRNIQKLSNTNHFRHRNLRELMFSKVGIFAALIDGTNMQIGFGRVQAENQQNNIEICKKIEHVDCLTYKNYYVNKAHFDSLPSTFPKLRSVEKLQIIDCSGNISAFTIASQLKMWNTADLYIKENTSRVFVDDDVISATTGPLIIENVTYADVTDLTMQGLLELKRPVFKLNNAVTMFTWKTIMNAIKEVVSSDWKIDWHFGVVGLVKQNIYSLYKPHCRNPPVWESLQLANSRGFEITFEKLESQTTIKIFRAGQTVQFATCELVAARIEDAYLQGDLRHPDDIIYLERRHQQNPEKYKKCESCSGFFCQ